MLEWLEGKGWSVLNGNKEGDEDGRWTYYKGEKRSTIDYAVVSEEAWQKINKFEVGERIESDHQPIIVEIKRKKKKNKKEKEKTRETQDWTESGIEKYMEAIEKMEWKESEVERRWNELKEGIERAVRKRKWRSPKMGKKPWWGKECRVKKKEAQKAWIKMIKGEGTKETYKEKLKNYKITCEEEKKKYREKEKKKVEKISNEKQAWAYINEDRDKQSGISDKITMESWRKHFMEVLEGSEESRDEAEIQNIREIQENEEEITREDVRRVIKKLKKGKAAGADKIKNEAWIYGNEKVEQKLEEIIRRVWKGEGYPEDWREGVIVPIHKKGNKDEPRNYRGVTLMSTAYKVYATVVNERLVEEIQMKNILNETQSGFRKGRGAIDNIYIINHIVAERIKKKRGKMFMAFVDLKAAFDMLDRKELWAAMRRKGISEGTIGRIKEMYRETKCAVRVGDEVSQRFWVNKGVRQGCPLSPTLFNIYVADLEETMRKGQDGGVVVGKRKIWTLGYADDMSLMAETEEDLKKMIERADKYFKRKKLEVNIDKTKVMVFGKGGGRRKIVKWKWGGKEIEEVRTMKYLGYVLTKNNTADEHVRERVKKARMVMGKVWSLGERRFSDDIKWRMKIFDAIVKSILLYGVEIWGWKEWEKIEKVQEGYIRWILGLDRTTPGYVVREEMKRDKLRVEAGARAMKFEEKIRKEENRKILRECWEEKMREEIKGKLSAWGNVRKEYFWRCGIDSREAERKRTGGTDVIEEMKKRDKEVQEQERTAKIETSKSVRNYKERRVMGTPRYFKGKRGETGGRVRRIARLRCGNEERNNRYWAKPDERKCRLCQQEEETLEHLAKWCRGMMVWKGEIGDLTSDDGKGDKWIKELEKRRKEKKRQEDKKTTPEEK